MPKTQVWVGTSKGRQAMTNMVFDDVFERTQGAKIFSSQVFFLCATGVAELIEQINRDDGYRGVRSDIIERISGLNNPGLNTIFHVPGEKIKNPTPIIADGVDLLYLGLFGTKKARK